MKQCYVHFVSSMAKHTDTKIVQRSGGSSKNCAGMLKVQFRPSLYLKKCDFVTHHYTKLLKKKPQHPSWNKLGAFLGKFSQMHPILQILHRQASICHLCFLIPY